MKALSKIAAGVSPSATLAVSALAKKMKAEGKDVIGFGAGEPDFATPDRISYAGVRAICDGKTRYTPAAGMIELRQAICDRAKADYGLEYEATQAVVASGAKHMVYIALAALVDPGDEVIVPAPYWVSYYEMVRLFGGVPVVVNVSEEQGPSSSRRSSSSRPSRTRPRPSSSITPPIRPALSIERGAQSRCRCLCQA